MRSAVRRASADPSFCGGSPGSCRLWSAVWAIWTSRATDAQGIADNTVAMIIAYLAGLAVLVLVWRVFDGFVRKPVDRPMNRWVIVPDGQQAESSRPTMMATPPRSPTPTTTRRRPSSRLLSPGTGNRQHRTMSPDAEPHGEHPFVVAHRGASADRPEHTRAAYELALQEGADGVECDVRLTRDGHLVCVHDRRVDRTSSGTGLVSDMTLAQLRELDWGAWHSTAGLKVAPAVTLAC